MLPPMEQISYELGSGGYQRPCSAAARLTSTLRAPGWTTATREATSISTARIRSVDRTMPPSTASAPPDRPVPAPRGTTGMPCRVAQRIASCTWAAVSARTAATGIPAVAWWVQSKRYFSSASGAVTTTPSGSIPTSSATAWSIPQPSQSWVPTWSPRQPPEHPTQGCGEPPRADAPPEETLGVGRTWQEGAESQAGVLSEATLRERMRRRPGRHWRHLRDSANSG